MGEEASGPERSRARRGLGPGQLSLLHGRWGVGVLVEVRLLVNEPAVTGPQDQVQKAKQLKDGKRKQKGLSINQS